MCLQQKNKHSGGLITLILIGLDKELEYDIKIEILADTRRAIFHRSEIKSPKISDV